MLYNKLFISLESAKGARTVYTHALFDSQYKRICDSVTQRTPPMYTGGFTARSLFLLYSRKYVLD